jgi:hypothetical protein
MRANPSVMIEVGIIQTPAAMTQAVIWMREYFSELRLSQPPLPDNFLALVPCSLLVTETPGCGGAITGKIRLADPDGAVLHEQEWLISAGQA